MNIGVKCWSDKNLDEILDKDIFLKLFSTYKAQLELYRKKPITSIEVHPKRIGKVLLFPKKQNKSLFLHTILNNKVLKFVLVSLLAFVLISLLWVSFSNAEKPTATYLNIQVHSGDTVWTIASQYASNKEDLRELVFAIKTMNGLNNNAMIYSGQTLRVPTPTN